VDSTDEEDTKLEKVPSARPPAENRTIELETSELKEMSQEGEAAEPENRTLGLLSTDLVELKPGSAVELDAKVEVSTQLVPRTPIPPDSDPRFGKPPPPDPTQHVARMPTPAAARRTRLLVIGVYFVATLLLGLAILSRC
jgi:hypothetical protein